MSGEFVNPITQSAILLSLAKLNVEEINRLKKYLSMIEANEFDKLYNLLDLNRSTTWSYKNLCKLRMQQIIPSEIGNKMQIKAAAIEIENRKRLDIAKIFLKDFCDKGIEVAILKGVFFAEEIYGDSCYKKMNDVDFLIKIQDVAAAIEVYKKNDFFSAGEVFGEDSKKLEKMSHHLPPYFDKGLNCMLGTHWGLISPLTPYKPDYQAIWKRVIKFDFYGLPLKALSVEDNLHHLCIHLSYYKAGIKELSDIYNIIRHYNEKIDWDLLIHEAKKANSINLIYHALSISNKLVPSMDVVNLLDKIRKNVSFYFRVDVNNKTKSQNVILKSRSTHLSKADKAYSKFKIVNSPKEKIISFLQMYQALFFPNREEVIKINYIEEPTVINVFIGRIVAPWRIFRVFCRDLGTTIFILLILSTFVSLFKRLLKAPFVNTSNNSYEEYAKKLGISVEKLEAFKEQLE